jgi:EpsI family protein
MGEALIPPLMEWTADFTILALQVSGIPVYREGLFFTIPSGNWSIVEGCSGVRYLIASLTVGVLFAYLSYRKPWKRLLFAAMSIIVPIIANGFRAYLIVMIAHLSNNKLAHGIDHFIYGWVFFGLVMLLLFWIGSFWRDSESGADARAVASPVPATEQPRQDRRLSAYAAAVLASVAVWPAYAAYLDRDDADVPKTLALAAPAPADGWMTDLAPLTDWRPRYDPASATVFQVYRKGERRVALYLAYYQHQRRGAQLISSTNIMVVQKHPVWSNVGASRIQASVGPAILEVRETRLRSLAQRLLIWDWFRVGGRDLTNPYTAKAMLAWRKLTDRGDDGAAVILATPYDEHTQVPDDALRDFAQAMMPSIDAALAQIKVDTVAGQPANNAAP